MTPRNGQIGGRLAQLGSVGTLVALVACSPGGGLNVPSTPTLQAAATQITQAASPVAATVVAVASPAIGTASALASPAIGTAQAAMTPAIATAQAAATPAAATAGALGPAAATAATPAVSTAVAGATTVANSLIRVDGITMSPTDTVIVIRNAGSAPIDLSGWQLRAGDRSATLPPNSRVGPNDILNVHTGTGTSAGRDVYLGDEGAALRTAMQPNTRLTLTNPQGNVVTDFTVPVI